MKRSPLAALALLLALACAACNDDDPEPRFGPPESTSPAPTETETTSEPPEPLGPEETVRAWVEARDVLMLKGDSSKVDALSAGGCTTCADQLDPLKDVHTAGGKFETKGWRVVASTLDSQADRHAQVTVGLSIAGGTTYPSANADPVEYGPEKRIARFQLVHSNDAWLVKMIGFLE